MSSSASTPPIRKRKSDGEVLLPPAAVDQAFVAVTHVSDGWDVDFGISVPAKASGVFKIPILMNVDPRGIYNYRTDPGAARPPPPAKIQKNMDVPEPVGFLLVQGEMRMHHQRSKDDPPVHFLEGEAEDGSDEDEGEVGCGPSGNVSEENVATLGLSDKTAVGSALMEFCAVLDPHVSDAGRSTK